jgi:hypothetical protein
VKYLLLITVDPSITPEEAPGEIDVWLDRVGDARLTGSALQPVATAKTVRVRKNDRLITDGPFVDTKEFVAGFDVVECDSLEEALDIAAGHPVAKFGAVEVRELWED